MDRFHYKRKCLLARRVDLSGTYRGFLKAAVRIDCILTGIIGQKAPWTDHTTARSLHLTIFDLLNLPLKVANLRRYRSELATLVLLTFVV